MNPPYSAGQKSANDNNQNMTYPRLDQRIADTYAALSTGTNKNSLYDSYFRALRWATDRIGDHGVIAFVSNSSFIDGNTADGVRLTWAKEFSEIFVLNLRGGARGKMGDAAAREGGNIFNILTGVAITILVKDQNHQGPATVHYAEADDYLTREDKLAWVSELASIAGTEFTQIRPNDAGDWINQRDENYLTFQPIGDKETKGKSSTSGVFRLFSRGLATARDAWCYGFSATQLATQMSRMIRAYNGFVEQGATSQTVNRNPELISWNRSLLSDLDASKLHEYSQESIRPALYRPFTRESVYFDRAMNDMVYQLPRLFPSSDHQNISVNIDVDGRRDVTALLSAEITDLHFMPTTQIFPLYTWEPLPNSGGDDLFAALDDAADASSTETTTSGTTPGSAGENQRLDFTRPIGQQIPTILGGYQRKDNITDATLDAYRAHYGDAQITKEDIFFYTYALLHHPTYRQRYAADLKKMLPRIPKATDFWAYANTGRDLADLHVNYEHVEPYPLEEHWAAGSDDLDDWTRYRVKKPVWAKRAKTADHTALVYNQHLTLAGIPPQAEDYTIGGRSALGWVIDRYQVRTHKDSGITNDPNDYCREIGRPDYIVDLIKRLVTVSMRTQELIAALPEFVVEEQP